MSKTPKLTWQQEALYRKMSDISEEAWCAGWMTGNEFALWDIACNPQSDRRYGQIIVSVGDAATLKDMADTIGGWIYWYDDEQEPDLPSSEWGPRFVPMERWKKIVNEPRQGGRIRCL